jgi:hypothetical protein
MAFQLQLVAEKLKAQFPVNFDKMKPVQSGTRMTSGREVWGPKLATTDRIVWIYLSRSGTGLGQLFASRLSVSYYGSTTQDITGIQKLIAGHTDSMEVAYAYFRFVR